MNDYLGYLTWWTVPECAAPYQALNQLAAQTGFPIDCVPNPPAPRQAWEKATNVGGARGLNLDAPNDKIDQVFIQYGTAPIVRLVTRRVSDAAPLLRRHLVREAVIPLAHDNWQQLSMQTVAVLEFDCTTRQSHAQMVHDLEGWTNGNISAIVQDIEQRRLMLLNHADGNDIREGVRKLLLRLHRVGLRGTGGVYFVPDSAPDAESQLLAMRAFIKSLRPWVTGKLQPSCNIVRLHGEEAEHLRDEIIESATEEFKKRLSDLADKVDPVLQGRVSGKVADRITQGAAEDLLLLQSAITAYRDSLHDEFAALTDMLQMAQAAIVKALGQA
jgi:hypothetical protein